MLLQKFLSIVKNVELDPCQETPKRLSDLLDVIVKSLFIEKTEEPKGIHVSETPPPPEKVNSIWVKTSYPYGIGVIGDGIWRMDYGLCGYHDKEIFLYNPANNPQVPGYVRFLNDDEIVNYGLVDTKNEKKDRLRWVIFEPPEITILS